MIVEHPVPVPAIHHVFCFIFTHTQEIKAINQEEFLRDRQEDEMEMSDNEDDGPAPKKAKKPDEPG